MVFHHARVPPSFLHSFLPSTHLKVTCTKSILKCFATISIRRIAQQVAIDQQSPPWSSSGASIWQGDGAIIDHGVVIGMSPAQSPSSSSAASSSPAAAGSTIHVAKSLDGPWTPLEPNTLGGCNNPAPWVHPNGTIYCLCGNSVLRTNSIEGPWEHISSLSHSGGQVNALRHAHPL